jgi:putative cell wall-binding protein
VRKARCGLQSQEPGKQALRQVHFELRVRRLQVLQNSLKKKPTAAMKKKLQGNIFYLKKKLCRLQDKKKNVSQARGA